ncbi:hypothetical protein G3N95_26795 [Paraburkholderia sp. Tr-20389]|uniref:hypothetical protein n=1 Tax=Paraburkholderia sp. Tr-20389 TaxID=2703903 RepID=UPI00197D4558|nr:hypothetical protein [Paraburkholderia sp. Tr-20389]MBN3756571.1 hypothetical protein [Paraburkholderia sp. Tr-20389]
MPENQTAALTDAIPEASVRKHATITIIAFSTMLVSVTQLIQTFVFWIVNRHQALEVIHLTPWLSLILQVVTPIALIGLLAAGIGLVRRKRWGRPLFAWTAIAWMLVVALLSYWIMTVVNLPVFLLAIWLLHKKKSADSTNASETHAPWSVRHVTSITCLVLSCTLHLWAWLAAISPSSWVWTIIPHGHPWHLLLPSAILLIAGAMLAAKSSRIWSAGVVLMVFCVAMGDLLVSSMPLSTSLFRYLPEPKGYGFLPYDFMIKYLLVVGGIALSMLHFSRRTIIASDSQKA